MSRTLSGFACLLFCATLAVAQPIRQVFDAWTLVCGEGVKVRTSCVVTLNLAVTDDPGVWVKTAARVDNDQKLQITFTVPPEAKILPSISLRGDRAIKAAIPPVFTAVLRGRLEPLVSGQREPLPE